MRDFTDKNEYLYDAFISYRHSELDQFVAETLHREMESFRLPRNLIKKLDESGKTRINRVFRDRDELPIASNLADPITEALEASEFLIVICSPRLPASFWCKKEIETFIQMHDRDHVLAVLIEGEPDESFPEELRFVESKRVNRDGTVTVERVPVEPLAADVRGKNYREIKKKIKEEVIRLAAPMFDCAYDELKQRHRERKMRKILAAAAVGSSVCFIFGSISTTMAWKIHGQNMEISEKSRKIEEQSEEIQEQYWTALKNYALGEADNALKLLEQGDRIEAVRTAKAILPNRLEEPEIPYTYQAEYALSKSLGVYESGETTIAEFMLKHDTNLSVCKVSPDGRRLLTVDDACTIYVWDLFSGELLLKNQDYNRRTTILEYDLDFLDKDTFCYIGYKKGVLFDIPTGAVTEFEVESGLFMKADKGGRQIAILASKEVRIFDLDNMEVTYKYTATDEWKIDSKCIFSEDGSKLAFSIIKGTGTAWEETKVLVMDCQSGEITNHYAMKEEGISQMVFEGDVLYVANNEDFHATENKSYLNEQRRGYIYACDLSTPDEIKWVFEDPENAMKYIKLAGKADINVFLCTSYSGVYLLDKKDGNLIGKEDLGEGIINVKGVVDGDNFFVYTRGGNIVFVRNNNGILEAVNFINRYQLNSDNLKVIEVGGNGTVITIPYNSAGVTVYRPKMGEKFQEVVEKDEYISSVAVSPDGNVLVVRAGGDAVGIYDTETGEQTGAMEAKSGGMDYTFVGTENEIIAMAAGRKLYLNESITGKAVAEYELDGYDLFFLGNSNEQVASISASYMVIYDTLTGKEMSRVKIGEKLGGGRFKAVNGKSRCMAVTFPDEGKVCLYSLDEVEELQTIPLNAAFVSDLFFDQLTDKLYVVYKDYSMEIYVRKNGRWSLKQKHKSFDAVVGRAINLGGDGSKVILKGVNKSYLLKDDEVIAEMPQLKAVGVGGQTQLYTSNRQTLLKVSLYDYDMLLEEAKGY